MVKHASATNAVFAFVLGLLAFLYITATAVLLCAEMNVVHVSHLHPRSLLTPFTDNVTLTAGDRRAYWTTVPLLGAPLADRISGSGPHSLKELRPGCTGTTEVRILFIFDPARIAAR